MGCNRKANGVQVKEPLGGTSYNNNNTFYYKRLQQYVPLLLRYIPLLETDYNYYSNHIPLLQVTLEYFANISLVVKGRL